MTFKEFRQDLQERLQQDPDLKTDRSTPAKNYKGLSKSTKEARERHWEKNRDKADNDPSAYEPAPGDENAKTKESKYTKAFRKRFGEGLDLDSSEIISELQEKIHDFSEDYTEEDFEKEISKMEEEVSEDVMDLGEDLLDEDSSIDTALKNKAEKSGIPLGILRQVLNRGRAAWKDSHKPGTNPDQWGLARCSSFITGGKTRFTADKDLWEKASAAKKKKEGKNSK